MQMTLYRYSSLFLSAALMLLSSSISFSHEAPEHEHAMLVPIPEYGSAHGKASAETALMSIKHVMASLNNSQKGKTLFTLDADERKIWSNLPAGNVPRQGIALLELSDEQRLMVFDFLSASLGEIGYKRVAEVMAAEAMLSIASPDRAVRLGWDPRNFFLAIYGEPSDKEPWGWGFGGHHLAINMAIEEGVTESISPAHIGSEPVTFTLNGVEYENMRDTHEVGLNLFNALNEEQREIAQSSYQARDVLTGPGKDGFVPEQEGIFAKNFTESQKQLLLVAIATWVEMQPDENASKRMAEIEAELNEISFLWAGNENPTTSGYYRIQGPSVIIEHLSFGANRRVGVDQNGHYHTMYRNPKNEYGLGPAEYDESLQNTRQFRGRQ